MEKITTRHIWSIVLPILISLLMEQMINITDTIFLGHYGVVELAASALAGVYYLSLFVIAFGFGIGVQIIIGRLNGGKRYPQIGTIAVQGIFFMLAIAVIMFTISRLWTPTLLRSIVESPEIYHATIDYLDWRVYGFFFAFPAIIFRAFYIGITQTKILTSNSLIMVSANVVLNYMLIFGNWGMPELGIAGAAIASSISELVSLVFFAIYTWRRIDRNKYGFTNVFQFRPQLLKDILSISSWMMIQNFISVSMWFVFFLAVEHLGEDILAQINVTRNASAVFFIIISSFSSTASTLISNSIGAGNPGEIFPICRRCMKLAALCILPLIVLCLCFPGFVAACYTDESQLAQACIPVIQTMAATIILSVPAFVLFSAVSGTGRTRAAFFIELSCLGFYLLSIYIIVIYYKASPAVCWLTDPLYCLVLIPVAWQYLKKISSQRAF